MIIALTAFALQSGALISQDFEKESFGWKGLAEAVAVKRTTNRLDVKNGEGALEAAYVPSPGRIPGIALATGDLSDARGIRFWVKSSHGTTLVVALMEREGERYNLALTIPQNEWTEIKANVEDFTLADDSPKQNQELDMNRIEAIAMVDALATFAIDKNASYIFGSREGTNAFWLDDFRVLRTEPMPEASKQKMLVDAFERDFNSWIPFKDMALSVSRGKGLTVKYERMDARIYALIRGVTPGILAGAKSIVLQMRSPQAGSFVIKAEETDGEKWQRAVTCAGGNESTEVVASFADFTKSDDSGNADDNLSPEKIKMLAIVDTSRAAAGTKNEFTIERVSGR